MKKNTAQLSLGQIESPWDALTEVLREGVRGFILRAVHAEFDAFMSKHDALLLDDGRKAVVIKSRLFARTVQTGIGLVEVQVPKARDRGGKGIKFNSFLPPLPEKDEECGRFIALALTEGGIRRGLSGCFEFPSGTRCPGSFEYNHLSC